MLKHIFAGSSPGLAALATRQCDYGKSCSRATTLICYKMGQSRPLFGLLYAFSVHFEKFNLKSQEVVRGHWQPRREVSLSSNIFFGTHTPLSWEAFLYSSMHIDVDNKSRVDLCKFTHTFLKVIFKSRAILFSVFVNFANQWQIWAATKLWIEHRWFARDSNPGLQDYRRRWITGFILSTEHWTFIEFQILNRLELGIQVREFKLTGCYQVYLQLSFEQSSAIR